MLRIRNRLVVIVAIGMLAVCVGQNVQATVITWGTASNVTSVNNLITDGTLVSAGTWSAGDQAVTVGSETITFRGYAGGLNPAGTNGGPYSGVLSGTYSGDTGNSALNGVLNGAFYGDILNANSPGDHVATAPFEVVLPGLTAGRNYQVELFWSDTRSATNTARTMTWSDTSTTNTYSSGAVATGGHDSNAVNSPGYVIGTFTATSTSVSIYGYGGELLYYPQDGSGQMYREAKLSGYVLRDVTQTPEPGTLVIVATGLSGLLAYAWRKRR
jgi:hypothetical protein